MSEETPAVNTDDLDAFATDFFGQKKEAPVETNTEKEEKPKVEADASTDTHSEAADTGNELEDPDGSSDEPETPAKGKKTRFQERIDELTAKAREAERERDELRAKLNKEPAPTSAPKTAPVVAELVEPTPADTNEDGTDKYPLGEYDPSYIKDLTKFALKSEKAAIEAEAVRDSEVAQMNAEKEALETSWAEKLPTAQERYPDFREKGEALIGTFSTINEAYGEYLSATIMSLENGTDVLYYLANNIDEANKIVAAGPSRATIMLGRLDAYFEDPDEAEESETPPPARKVTKATTPPPQNKGTSVAKASIADDTDDLDEFSTKYFDKRYGKRR